MIPWIKYPPNPPGVGDPDTIDQRTLAYLSLLTLSVVALLAAYHLATRLAARQVDQPWRWVAAVAVVVVVIGISYVVLPAPDALPAAFDADVLWRFRLASIGGLAAMWGAMSLTMAVLCGVRQRAGRRHRPAMSSS